MFAASSLHVFQAVDIDLRKRYEQVTCDPHLKEDEYITCLKFKAEGMASRSQLALLVFEMEQKSQGNGATEFHQLRKSHSLSSILIRQLALNDWRS